MRNSDEQSRGLRECGEAISFSLARRWLRPLRVLAMPLLTALVPAPGGVAAQGRTVAGVVLEAGSLQPLVGAQIRVAGSDSSVFTNASGRFVLRNLSGDRVTLLARMIGYRTAEVTVQVGTQDVRLHLEATAITLDEVIVTGTAAGEQKRALGNAVAKIAASTLTELAPVQNVGNLLNGRAPGVVLQAAQGTAGGGERILIRGRGSMAFVGTPLIYVDGVRVNNEFFSGVFTPEANAPMELSRLNDIDPGDIESIEVIKGAAAATLYGTEASAGVIQIITKKGRAGRAALNIDVRQGVNHLDTHDALGLRWGRDAQGNVFQFDPIDVLKQETGTNYFRNGHIQGYGASVSGGSESMQYYISGDLDKEEGIIPSNTDRRFRGRANLTMQPRKDLTINASFGLTEAKTTTYHYLYFYSGRYALPGLLDTPALGFLGLPPNVQNETQDLSQKVNHGTTSVQINHQPKSWFTHRLSLGFDRTDVVNQWLIPYVSDQNAVHFSPTERLGQIDITGNETSYSSVDYGATVQAHLSRSISSSSSAGFQYYRRLTNVQALAGQQFPTPGVASLAGITGPRQASASTIENTTVGLYLQQQFALNDRLFLTAAIRGDDNSAFGSQFDIVTYPKVSASWVIGEEPFWKVRWVNALRFRAAFGESGQQPDAFAAIRTYRPISGWKDLPAGSPNFIGNPELGPERSQELEVGFDAGLFNDRVGIEFTGYYKKTKDAIVARQVAPSAGFPSSQFVNAGEIENKGIEMLVTGRLLETRNVDLELSFNLSYNKNKVLSIALPGVDGIPVGWIPNWHIPGYPVGSFFGRKIVNAEVGSTGALQNVLCDDGNGGGVDCESAPDVYLGANLPHTEGSVQAALTLFDRFRVGALVDFKIGRKYLGADKILQCLFFANHEINFHPEKYSAEDRALCEGYPGVRFWDGPVIIGGSFAKLREVSLNYNLPDRLARAIGSDRTSLTVAARNVHTWFNRTPFHGADPEVFTNINFGSSNHDQAVVPLPLQLMVTLNVRF